jgi:hypothetical protein
MRIASGRSCLAMRKGSRSLNPGGSHKGLSQPCHQANTSPLAASNAVTHALTPLAPFPSTAAR